MLCSRLALGFLCATLALSARAVTVRVTEADGSRLQVALHPGDVLRVDLAAEPVTGRTWSVHGHAPAQLMELGATQRVFGGRMSNQGRSSFSWRAINEGEGELTVVYGTAVSRATNPEKTLKLQITVSGEPLGPEEAHPPAVSQLEQAGVYEQTGPCGDCSQLVEQLTLFRGSQESPFVLRRTYKDAPGGTLTSIATGSWSSAKGTADPAATIYTFTTSSEAFFVRVAGDRLIPLDAQQIPIPSPPGMDTAFRRMTAP
jgi:predicted secreted protein